MEARNLREEDCKKLEETMQEIKETNPEAEHEFFREKIGKLMEEGQTTLDVMERLDKIENKVDALNGKIDTIFGNSVLIAGKWKNITP